MIGCMNLESSAIPPNMRSRFMSCSYAPSARPGNYQLTDLVLTKPAAELQTAAKQSQQYRQDLHLLFSLMAIATNFGIIKCSMEATDAFIMEVLQLAAG
jgi:hypothetical protein